MLLLNCIVAAWIVQRISGSPFTSAPTLGDDDSCHAPVVANANIAGGRENFTVSETLEVVCRSGFRFPNINTDVIHVKCTKGGKWMDVLGYGPIPPCERTGSCPVPQIDNGEVLLKDGGYMPGEQAPVLCHGGSESALVELDSDIICQSDGSWRSINDSAELPKCQVMACKVDEIQNGRIKYFEEIFTVPGTVPSGTSVAFFCDPGYSLSIPKTSSVCQHGRWSTDWPECVPESQGVDTCKMPETLANGRYGIYGDVVGDFFARNTQVVYYCNNGYKLVGLSVRVCWAGQWSGQTPSCIQSSRGCEQPPQIKNGHYTCLSRSSCDGDERIANGTTVYYYCDSGYVMRNSGYKITCKGYYWEGSRNTLPVCELRTKCDEPMAIPNGNWVIDSYYPDYRIGSRITYRCYPGYKAISGKNATTVTCLESGYWSDYAPRCLPIDSYCTEPASLENGFYMCNPNSCNLFKMGTQIEYACNKGYRLSEDQTKPITCSTGGTWSFGSTELYCIRETHHSKEPQQRSSSLSTATVVISTSCSVLGLLVIVMIIFLIQRRKGPLRQCRGRHGPGSGYMPPPPPAYSEVAQEARLATAVVSENDRTALISFADGSQATLPSYDEVVRSRYPPRLHPLNGDCIRGPRSGSEYRTLPPVTQQMRHNSAARELSPEHRDQRDQHSISSHPRGDALSVTFGSVDTMNVSDNTSTTVTLGTYESGASNPSLATSQRAAVGSMNSSNPSLTTDEAPLLEGHDTLSHRSQTASPSIPEVDEEGGPK